MGKWEMVRLGDVGKVITGNTPKTNDDRNYSSNDLNFYKPSDFTENTINLLTKSDSSVSNYARSKCRVIPANSVLVTCIGIIGKIGITTRESTCNQQINAIIPDSNKCLSSFLAYAISRSKTEMNHVANAAIVPIINKSQFSNITIPLPPLPIQQKIADVLDHASILIEKRKAQIAKLDLLVKSQFIEMFGDPVTNPKGWDEKRFEDCISFLTSGSRGWSRYFSSDGEMFITIKNVKNCSITIENMQFIRVPNSKEAERTRVKEGDLLISITADLGRTGVISAAIAGHGAYINQHLSLIRLKRNDLNPIYASYYFESNAGKTQFACKNQVGVKSGLSFNSINSLTILIPPPPLQNRFAEFVHAVDKSKSEIQRSLDKLELLYKSLMQQYFC